MLCSSYGWNKSQKNLQFNLCGEYIIGLEDFGYDHRTYLQVFSALCFMISMSANWRQLIGYDLSAGPMKLKDLYFLLEKFLKLNKIGLKAMCITDQGSNFSLLFKTLGIIKWKPYFHSKIDDVNYVKSYSSCPSFAEKAQVMIYLIIAYLLPKVLWSVNI